MVEDLKCRIIRGILADPDVVVKSQQIGEPEMTLDEKRAFLEEFIEEKKPSIFLAKFNKHLQPEWIPYFESRVNGDPDERYCVNYYTEQLQKILAPKPASVRNRRFGALQELLDKKDEYFSELEMMRREPELYEQLVGQYMTGPEKQMRDRCENPTFLSALLKGIEMEHLREHTEKRAIEEKHSDLSESDDDEGPAPSSSLWGEFDDAPKRQVVEKRTSPKNVSDAEKDEMKREFIEIMYQKFLSGQDTEYDYSNVDNNGDYDDLEMETQDQQDKYFDESEEEVAMPISEDEDQAVR